MDKHEAAQTYCYQYCATSSTKCMVFGWQMLDSVRYFMLMCCVRVLHLNTASLIAAVVLYDSESCICHAVVQQGIE